jgi:hypothetical protein
MEDAEISVRFFFSEAFSEITRLLGFEDEGLCLVFESSSEQGHFECDDAA